MNKMRAIIKLRIKRTLLNLNLNVVMQLADRTEPNNEFQYLVEVQTFGLDVRRSESNKI